MATATRISKPGSTPQYNYRGVQVSNSAGSKWGRGWLYVTEGDLRYSTTLEGAKWQIDCTFDN
jgi:hypothetical protein